MNKASPTSPVNPKAPLPESRSMIVPIAVIMVLAVALGLMIGYRFSKPSVASASTPESNAIADKNVSIEPAPVTGEQPEASPAVREESLRQRRTAARLNNTQPSAEATSPLPASSAVAQQLIAQLAQVDVSHGALNPEQVRQLKENLAQLTAQGAAAVPAIREFLEKNQDLSFGGANGKTVSYSSLRASLIDSLGQIGGPEAQAVLTEILRGNTDPLEVALLARNLEEQSPGSYRLDELDAARAVMDLAANGQLKGKDLGPILELFHAYGDASVVPDLQKIVATGKWVNYIPFELAELPQGAGINALIDLLGNSTLVEKDQNHAILRSLAQASADHPEAFTAVLGQAKANQIPDSAWTGIAAALSGKYFFPYAQTVFSGREGDSAPSTGQVSQRMAMIDQLLAANQSQAATKALQQAHLDLASRAK